MILKSRIFCRCDKSIHNNQKFFVTISQKNKKCISPVIAVALLLIVTVVAVVGFEGWFGTYQGGLMVGVEEQHKSTEPLRVQGIVGDELYLYSGENGYFSLLKIMDLQGNQVCQLNSNGIDSSIVAYWKMDGDALDSSGNGNDGSVSGAVYNPEGKIDGAYEFDGVNDNIVIPSSTDFNFLNTEEFSISMWVKSNGDCSNNNGADVFASRYGVGHTDSTWWFGCDQVNQTIKFFIFQTNSINHKILGTTPINDSNWHNVGWVFDGVNREVKIFLDGNFEKVETLNLNNDFTNSNIFCIGGYGSGSSCTDFDFDGLIDDFKVYNKSLTASDISNLYLNSGKNLEVIKGVNKYNVSSCSLISNEKYNVVGFTNWRKLDSIVKVD